MIDEIHVGDYVCISGVGEVGEVIKIRFDSRGEAIYDIDLIDQNATPTGTYIARCCEITKI